MQHSKFVTLLVFQADSIRTNDNVLSKKHSRAADIGKKKTSVAFQV